MIGSQPYTWELPLLSRAHEAYKEAYDSLAAPDLYARAIDNRELLRDAYEHCERLTSVHSRSFHLASSLLPWAKRRAARALYAFCRVSDDIVDESEEQAAQKLAVWRSRTLSPSPAPEDLVSVAWHHARTRYAIPQKYAEQLLDGVGRDLQQHDYETFAELATYCYGVASTVGLMSMHIVGFSGREAIPYAVKLGVALQLTNILRDVGEDWQAGRLYLPREELAAFGLTEADLAHGRVDDRWRSFMRYQIRRNRRLYKEAWPGIGMLNADGRLAIAVAAGVYRAILDDIERHDYDVFRRRAHVTTWGKLRRLPGLWWQSRGFNLR